jgi:hypothetical protein
MNSRALLRVVVVGFGIAAWTIGRRLLRRTRTLDVGAVSPDWLSRQRGQRETEFP